MEATCEQDRPCALAVSATPTSSCIVAATVAVLLAGFVIAAGHLRRRDAAATRVRRADGSPSAPPTAIRDDLETGGPYFQTGGATAASGWRSRTATSSPTRSNSRTAARSTSSREQFVCGDGPVDVATLAQYPGEHRDA